MHEEGDAWIEDELDYLSRIAVDNAKNYQLWNHRRRLAFYRGPAHGLEVCHPAICFRSNVHYFVAQ